MIVMKFGGASLANVENIEKTRRLVASYSKKDSVILIVSAMKGVTDELYQVVHHLTNNDLSSALAIVEKQRKRHIATLQSVSHRRERFKTQVELHKLFEQLTFFIKNTVKKGISPAREDYIVSYGERFSCRLIAEALEAQRLLSYPIDASLLLYTNKQFGNAEPLFGKKQVLLKDMLTPLLKNDIIPVITGFIGLSVDGCTTTLGRGGSDLSASFFAHFLDAKKIVLWKDVEGFFTADPKKDKNAKLFGTLPYKKARELAKNGAKVVYYKAIDPAENKRIPIHIKSFNDPERNGTIIYTDA